MAITTTLHLFYVDNLPSDENYALEVAKFYENYSLPLTTYLNEVARTHLTVNNFQLQRIQLDNVFTVALTQDYAQSILTYGYNINYLTLYYTDDNVNYEIPYKISKIIWNGTESCKIICTLDVATLFINNSYKPDIIKDGIIERSHIDRFVGVTEISGTNYLIPKVDYHEEPIDEAPKYLNSTVDIKSSISLDKPIEAHNWNIIYYSDPNATNAIRTFIVPDENIASITARVEMMSNITIEADTYYVFRKTDNSTVEFTYNGNTITFDNTYSYEELHVFNDGGTFTVTLYGWNTTLVANNWKIIGDANTIHSYTSTTADKIYFDEDVLYYINPSLLKQAVGQNNYGSAIPVVPQNSYIVSTSSTQTSVNLTGLKNIPLTNPRLIKIISCPFAPVNLTDTNCVWRKVADDYMKIYVIEYLGNEFNLISKYTTSFIDMIQEPADYDETLHSSIYETKMYNSSFTEYRFEYGSYNYLLQPENYDYDSSLLQLSIDVSYKQAMLKSDLLFYIYPNNDPNSELPTDERNLVSRYLISDIDNEKPIFTSDYINYIKNGYNYDKSNMNRQTLVSSLLAGTSIVGGVVGVAAGAVTGGVSAAAGIGLITSGVSSAINIINNRISNEKSIQQKLTSYKNSSTGVAGVNALDIRKEYFGTKLMKSEYLMNDDLQNDIYNLFRKYGYQINKYSESINDYLYSRRFYNYIKFKTLEFDTEFVAKNKKHSDLLDEFKRILLDGLTIYHLISSTSDFDFDKQYENFEVILS